MSNGDRRLFIKLNLPEEIGEVYDSEVDSFLQEVQQIQALNDVECTVCCRVNKKPGEKKPDVKRESEATRPSNPQKDCVFNMGMLANDSPPEGTKYYCKTAPRLLRTGNDPTYPPMCCGQTNFTPTILVEMFYSWSHQGPSDKNLIVDGLTDALNRCIVNRNEAGKQTSVSIKVISFFLGITK